MNTTTAMRLGAFAALLTLAACTPPPPPGASAPVTPAGTTAPAPDASPAPSASSAATPTAAAPAAPDPAPAPAPETDYDFTRLYDLHIGDTFSDHSIAAGAVATPLAVCPWLADVTVPGQDPNIYLSWESEAFDPPGPTHTFIISGDVAAVATFDSPLNAEGIGVGSTAAEVLAQYPDAVSFTNDFTAFGTLTQIRVDAPHSGDRYYFWIDPATNRVFRIEFGEFFTDGYWPNAWDCVD